MNILIILLSTSDFGMGAKIAFSGGPIISLLSNVSFNDNISMNLSIGGFPGIIMKVESNLRCSKKKEWSPYLQGGLGFTRFFRGKAKDKNLNDIHFNVGITKSYPSSLKLSADIGLLYAPYGVNYWLREESPDITYFIYPVVNFEVLF